MVSAVITTQNRLELLKRAFKSILKQTNELLIKTGKNLFQTAYVDYDDIEIANLRIEVKEKYHYARR